MAIISPSPFAGGGMCPNRILYQYIDRSLLRRLSFLSLVLTQAAQAQCVSLIVNTCTFILRNLKWR